MKKDPKEEIIKNTITVFAKNGVDGAGMKEIGRACGMSPASLYYHFKNKHDLVYESIKYVAYQLIKQIDLVTQDTAGLESRYKTAIKSIADYIKTHEEEARFYGNVIILPPKLMFSYEEWMLIANMCPVYKMVEEGIRDGIFCDLPNIIFMGYYPIYPFMLNNMDVTTEQINEFVDRLWSAISIGGTGQGACA